MKVIYIVGLGRSGSTVLNILLGAHPDIFGAGELAYLPQTAWLDRALCACGQPGSACPFWSDVQKEWFRRTHSHNIQEYIALQEYFGRIRFWPRIVREHKNPSQLFRTYTQKTIALYQAMQTVSGKPYIVDSSKRTPRALALAVMPDIDVYPIHLIRDGRGAIWSYAKSFQQNNPVGIPKRIKAYPAWRTSLQWLLINRLAEHVLHRTGRGIRIRYEDMADEYSKQTLQKLGSFLGIGLDNISTMLESGFPFEVGHTVAGNRLRMNHAIHIQPDYEWKKHLTKQDSFIFRLIAGRLAKKYGYL